jgi:hypothetical protein
VGTIKSNDMNKLIFKGKEYELIEVNHDKFRIYGMDYNDIGFITWEFKNDSIPVYDCYSLRIKDKYYGLKLIEK